MFPGGSSHLLSPSRVPPALGVSPDTNKASEAQSTWQTHHPASPTGSRCHPARCKEEDPAIRALAQNSGRLRSVPRFTIHVKAYVS